MFVFQSALQTLKKYADFKGRASREEFWCFFVFVIVANALCSLAGLLLGLGPALGGLVGLLLVIPQIAVAVRRLHDLSKDGKELVVPCVMLFLVPVAFAFRGFLPKIVALDPPNTAPTSAPLPVCSKTTRIKPILTMT